MTAAAGCSRTRLPVVAALHLPLRRGEGAARMPLRGPQKPAQGHLDLSRNLTPLERPPRNPADRCRAFVNRDAAPRLGDAARRVAGAERYL